MSLLVFEQIEGTARGLFLYDAPPEWQIEPFQQRGDLVQPRCSNGEGTGGWLIFDPQRGFWGGLLRRGDAPYNDCLPPGESVLSRAFREGTRLDAIADSIREQTESGFYNPFNALLGDLDGGRLLLVEQSFRHRRRPLEPGVHLLQDEREPDNPTSSGFETLPDPLPPQEELKRFARNRSDQHGPPPLSNSGLRVTRSACLFQTTAFRLQLDSCHGYPPEDPWQTITISVETSPAE